MDGAPQVNVGRDFLTIAQFAMNVGVCRNTVKNWLQRGLPVIRIGRNVRIPREQAVAWMQQCTVAHVRPAARSRVARQDRQPTFRAR